ncbi:MAG: hypothetical protein KDA78_18795 [Planctomycetaceae bacterium]|nr:hypothetical protein [Planctomycetaceae bacterium]
MTSSVEQQYQKEMDALLPYERMERCIAMVKWSRELLERQIRSDQHPSSEERIQLIVARRIYSSSPMIVAHIDQRLDDVPG